MKLLYIQIQCTAIIIRKYCSSCYIYLYIAYLDRNDSIWIWCWKYGWRYDRTVFFHFVSCVLSSNTCDTSANHMSTVFSSLQRGICSRRWALRLGRCDAKRIWWCACVPRCRPLLNSSWAKMGKKKILEISSSAIGTSHFARGWNLTSHEWLMKRAAFPRIVASTTRLSSILNM